MSVNHPFIVVTRLCSVSQIVSTVNMTPQIAVIAGIMADGPPSDLRAQRCQTLRAREPAWPHSYVTQDPFDPTDIASAGLHSD